MKKLPIIPACFACILCILVIPVFAAHAQPEDERQFLLMYFTEEELVVESPTRSPKPISQVAENVTVVTAEDIQLMNAHTVADVLNTVTGVQVYSKSLGNPGASAVAFIQGSDQRHVAVFIDGIPLSSIVENTADLGTIPVQNIEKIEIIKGPASSAWGSALGGVVNIVTKSGKNGMEPGGLVSASYGKRNTGDFRAEGRGKQVGLAYYLTAGRLQTDGLRPNFDVSENNAYAKVTYNLAEKTNFQFTLGYSEGQRGAGEFQIFDQADDDDFSIVHSAVTLNGTLGKNIGARFSLWSLRERLDSTTTQLSSGSVIAAAHYRDEGYGASAELTWNSTLHALVFGADVDSKSLESNRISGGEQALRKVAVYLNDTISLGSLAVTPGIRYDDTNTNHNFTSPSLGVTYRVTETTVLRAYGATGFSIPPLAYTVGDNLINFNPNPALKMERVSSVQAGVETAALKYFWLKVSAFRHEIRDALSLENISGPLLTAVNSVRQRRQGAEAEVKTAPVYNTSLTAGAEYISAKDLNTGLTLLNIPKMILDLGIVYDNEGAFNASLKGRYINWNSEPAYQGNYGNFLFDLNGVKVLSRTSVGSTEAFISVHNIFNGSQYQISIYKNTARWIEGGLRFNF
jgi:vitamin B12 transporter